MSATGQLVFLPPPRPLVERLGAEFFRAVPERPGVYLMCGAESGVLYVGKAKNLRQRLNQYRSANWERAPRKLRRLLAAVERIHWDECADEAAALAREKELLLTLRPRFNRVGVFPAPQMHLGWRCGADGLEFGVSAAADEWPEQHGPISGARYLLGAVARLLWWTAHPERGWDALPAELHRDKAPTTWWLAGTADVADEARARVAGFFRGGSPELIEWAVWSGARRPNFERAWIARDALALLDYFEKLTEARAGAAKSEVRNPESE